MYRPREGFILLFIFKINYIMDFVYFINLSKLFDFCFLYFCKFEVYIKLNEDRICLIFIRQIENRLFDDVK